MRIWILNFAFLLTFPLYGNTPLDWESFSLENGIQLYKSSAQASGVIPFKAEAVLEGPFEIYLKLLLDPTGRPTWAPKLKKIEIHKSITPNHFIYSEFYHTPWPASDRQFLLAGKVHFLGPKHVVLSAQNALQTEYIDEDYILCDVNFLEFELEEIEKGKTRMSFTFIGDMKGWMPIWLINLIQKKWPLRFIQKIREGAQTLKPVNTDIYDHLIRKSGRGNK
jgi:hypothetical protein